MKICLILAGDEEGGLENHFVELCNELSKEHSIIAIAHSKYRERFNPTVKFEAFDLSRSRKSLFLLIGLLRLINKNDPTIVHAHANKAVSILATIKPWIKVPIVGTVHSQKNNVSMFNKIDYVIGVSHAVLDKINNPQKTVIYNGIDNPLFKLRKEPLKKNELDISNSLPIVIVVGRLVKAKGIDVLIEAWSGIDANLLIVGDGPNLEVLKTQAGNNINKKIKFLGYREDVNDLLKFSDLTVISSRREGFSYVVAESLMLKTPIVATDVPVANEILPQEYIVEIENPKKLRECIKHALEDLSILKDSFEDVFEFSMNEFSIHSMVRKTSELYYKIEKQALI